MPIALQCLCPYCGRQPLAFAAPPHPEDTEPAAGDISLCADCGRFSRFDHGPQDSLVLRRSTLAEQQADGRTPRLVRAVWVWRRARARMERPSQTLFPGRVGHA